jgi:H+/Cl- antiporter ClcA
MRGVRMGMAGGPLTAFIIVMEMVSGQAMVLSLMACALLSSGVAHHRGLHPPAPSRPTSPSSSISNRTAGDK